MTAQPTHDAGPEAGRTIAPQTLMSTEQTLHRTMWTGTIWFAVAIGSIAIGLGPLLASGWRPAVLPVDLAAVWWLGAVVLAAGVGMIGWSGCPVLEVDQETANRNKSRTMQLGTASFLVGGALVVAAVLLGPTA